MEANLELLTQFNLCTQSAKVIGFFFSLNGRVLVSIAAAITALVWYSE
jgi:hypothetical protein